MGTEKSEDSAVHNGHFTRKKGQTLTKGPSSPISKKTFENGRRLRYRGGKRNKKKKLLSDTAVTKWCHRVLQEVSRR